MQPLLGLAAARGCSLSRLAGRPRDTRSRRRWTPDIRCFSVSLTSRAFFEARVLDPCVGAGGLLLAAASPTAPRRSSASTAPRRGRGHYAAPIPVILLHYGLAGNAGRRTVRRLTFTRGRRRRRRARRRGPVASTPSTGRSALQVQREGGDGSCDYRHQEADGYGGDARARAQPRRRRDVQLWIGIDGVDHRAPKVLAARGKAADDAHRRAGSLRPATACRTRRRRTSTSSGGGSRPTAVLGCATPGARCTTPASSTTFRKRRRALRARRDGVVDLHFSLRRLRPLDGVLLQRFISECAAFRVLAPCGSTQRNAI